MPAHGQQRGSRPLDRQVLTATDLQHAGLRRLGDIFLLIDAWDANTIAGFTWQASPQGLAPFERPGWTVMLDGQIVDLDLFGVRSLDRLPITISELDSVEVISTPRLMNGELIDGGSIRLHSRRSRDGFSVGARLATANETGDPGPFQFTSLASPNIDRIGSGVSGVAAYGTARGSIALSGKWQEHFVTDPLIRRRTFDITVGEFPIIKQTAVSLKGALQGAGGHHALYLGRSWTRDYFFLATFGREVPVESPSNQAGVYGAFRLTGPTSLRYRASYTTNALDQRANALDLDFDWELRRWRVVIEAARQRRSHRATLGVAVERASAKTGYALSDDGLSVYRTFAELAYRLSEATEQTIALQLTEAEGDLGLRAAMAHRWSPNPHSSVEAVVALLERLPAEDGRIWLWHQRGYGFLPDAGVEVTAEEALETARTLAGDLRWKLELGDRLWLRLGAYARSLSGLALEQQTFEFDPASQVFSGPVRLSTDQDGEVGGAEVAADWSNPAVHLRAYYRYQDVLGGGERFREGWRAVPRHRLRISGLYTPWESLSLSAMLRYRSSTRWVDYRLADEQTRGLYTSTLDDALVVDVGVQNWFWDRRLRGHLLFHNVFNDAVPHHPIGAAYDLSVAVQAELLLEGL